MVSLDSGSQPSTNGRRSRTGKEPARPAESSASAIDAGPDADADAGHDVRSTEDHQETTRNASPDGPSNNGSHLDKNHEQEDQAPDAEREELQPEIQSIGTSKSAELPPRDHQQIPKPGSILPSDRHRQSSRWFNRWSAAFSPVVWLENKSSVARDHLANERTFLAWFRTSLSLTSIGIALAQLSRIPKQIRTNQVSRSIALIQPVLEPLDSVSKRSLVLDSSNERDVNGVISNSNSHNLNQSDSIESIRLMLNQINHSLINLQSSIDHFNQFNIDDDLRAKSLASSIGNCYVCLGLLFLFIGTCRYFRVQKVLQTGQFPHSRRSICFTTIIVTALLIATVVGMFKTSI